MFGAIMAFMTTNFPTFISMLGDVLSGGVDLIISQSAGVDTIMDTADDVYTLTDTGSMLLLGSVVGLGLFALRFVRSLIPFLN